MNARKVALALSACAALALVLELPACHASSAVGAVAMTSLAGGYSAVRRANGECYIDCLPGTVCNRATGLCDPLDCQGKCGAGFVCEESGTGSACVPREQSNQYVSAPREVSGAQPFGDGPAAQSPKAAAAISSGGAATPAGSALPASPAAADASLSTRAGGSANSTSAGVAASGASTAPAASAGAPSASSAADGGVARVPAAALQLGGPSRTKDVPTRSNSIGPSLDNAWDPHQPEPVPQMDNPNQPPPH